MTPVEITREVFGWMSESEQIRIYFALIEWRESLRAAVKLRAAAKR